MPELVVASIVSHSGPVLGEFLNGLRSLEAGPHELQYLLVDAGGDAQRARLLREWAEGDDRVRVASAEELLAAAAPGPIKDVVMALALEQGASHVLLVDSDLVVAPGLARHLLALGHDIVGELFWTEVQSGALEVPNAWLCDAYGFYPPELAQAEPGEQAAVSSSFVTSLRQAGTYSVGGVSGCVLVSAVAVAAGVNFRPLPNVSFRGEDCHFAIRAAALGFEIWLDSSLPALRLWQEQDIGKLLHFSAMWRKPVAVA
jgi:hypothetical protein